MCYVCGRFIVGEICAALLHIHELGLSFNDLKPENILITEIGHIKVRLTMDGSYFCHNILVNDS